VADHGISQTARALGLDYHALKKHVDADRPSTPAFVEGTMSGLGPVSECQLELADERGTRLRVALRGAAVVQADAVPRNLLPRGQLADARVDDRSREGRPDAPSEPATQGG